MQRNIDKDGVDAGWRNFYSTAKARAKHRKLLWKLDFETFKIKSSCSCFYCGFVQSPHENYYTYTYNNKKQTNRRYVMGNGLDRIDSNGHYTPYNVVACCKWCNQMKNSLTHTEFLAHISRIYALHCIPKQLDLFAA